MMNTDMSTTYTKDQQKAIDTIINQRPSYMTCDRHLFSDKHNVVLSNTTLLVLQEPLWSTGKEFDVGRLIQSNETRDTVSVQGVSTERTHYWCRKDYCKLAEDAFFDPTVLKRAFRAMKYRGEEITLHYTIDQRTQQRYCKCLTFRTKYGYALVMACRIKDESALHEVGTSALIKRGELLQ
nr:MAG TPA: hypothetical protein [Caudoviricetes sp.]